MRRLTPAIVARAVGGLLCAALVALWLQRPGPPTYTISADFNRAGLNIRAGDEVRVRGFPVGHIASIDTDRRDFSARYTLRIDRDVKIARDSGAKIVPKTLFGDKYVELQGAERGQAAMPDGGHIAESRTKAVTEFQQVLDRFTPALQAIDPGALGGTISAFAAGIGNGADLGHTITGFGTTFEEVAGRQADIAALLAHTPGAAQTFGEHAGDFTTIATDMGDVARMLAANQPQLSRFLHENANLLGQAGELMTTERDRIERVTANGFDVLRMVAARPGSIKAFMAGQAATTKLLPTVVHGGVMFAGIPHLIVNFPTPMQKGGVGDGHSAIGPDVTLYYPAPPGEPGGANPPPQSATSSSPTTTAPPPSDPTGLGGLLRLVAMGGVS
jgi:phospholipid/cholesterol/gamma-HCH transport system substrate-binding protein